MVDDEDAVMVRGAARAGSGFDACRCRASHVGTTRAVTGVFGGDDARNTYVPWCAEPASDPLKTPRRGDAVFVVVWL